MDAVHAAQEAITGSPLTHVGIVVMVTVGAVKKPFIIESTTNPCMTEDAFCRTNRGRRGLWAFHLLERLTELDAAAWLYSHVAPLSDAQKEKLEAFVFARYKQDPPYDLKQMLATGLMPEIVRKDDFKAFFCSEFVAAAFKHIDLLAGGVNASIQTPGDISKYPFLKQRLHLKTKGACSIVQRADRAAPCLLCSPCGVFSPPRGVHQDRNRYGLIPRDDLVPVKDLRNTYEDASTGLRWTKAPLKDSLFDCPCCYMKLVSVRAEVLPEDEWQRLKVIRHGPGTVTSSEFVMPRAQVMENGTLPLVAVQVSSFNLRDPRYAGCCAHWCADVLPMCWYCDWMPGCKYIHCCFGCG